MSDPQTEAPPDDDLGWADSNGAVLWSDMDKHIRWLADKAAAAGRTWERSRYEEQAECLLGWCKLFDHVIGDALAGLESLDGAQS